jgi:hypothetical protein
VRDLCASRSFEGPPDIARICLDQRDQGVDAPIVSGEYSQDVVALACTEADHTEGTGRQLIDGLLQDVLHRGKPS